MTDKPIDPAELEAQEKALAAVKRLRRGRKLRQMHFTPGDIQGFFDRAHKRALSEVEVPSGVIVGPDASLCRPWLFDPRTIPTGIELLDRHLGEGLKRGELAVFCADQHRGPTKADLLSMIREHGVVTTELGPDGIGRVKAMVQVQRPADHVTVEFHLDREDDDGG